MTTFTQFSASSCYCSQRVTKIIPASRDCKYDRCAVFSHEVGLCLRSEFLSNAAFYPLRTQESLTEGNKQNLPHDCVQFVEQTSPACMSHPRPFDPRRLVSSRNMACSRLMTRNKSWLNYSEHYSVVTESIDDDICACPMVGQPAIFSQFETMLRAFSASDGSGNGETARWSSSARIDFCPSSIFRCGSLGKWLDPMGCID